MFEEFKTRLEFEYQSSTFSVLRTSLYRNSKEEKSLILLKVFYFLTTLMEKIRYEEGTTAKLGLYIWLSQTFISQVIHKYDPDNRNRSLPISLGNLNLFLNVKKLTEHHKAPSLEKQIESAIIPWESSESPGNVD